MAMAPVSSAKMAASDGGPGARANIHAFDRPSRSVPITPERSTRILGTLQEISKASADMEGCGRLLECVANELKAEQGVLILCNPLTKKLEFVVYNQDPGLPKLYADYFSDLDPTGLPEYIKGSRSLSSNSPGLAVFDLMEVLDYDAFVSSEFYNDFWKHVDIHYDLVAFMAATPLARGALCLHRGHRAAPFTFEEAAVLELIAPFVGNHLEKIVSATVLSVLQTAENKGLIVCDSRGRVLYCNDIARELCSPLGRGEEHQGLVEQPSSDAQVGSFVGYALDRPDVLAESCNLGVSTREVVLDQGSRARLITLEPRDGMERSWNEPLRERFALSGREIEVLNQLVAGGTNKEISRTLFIAECTVKKHVQNIAAKVGVHTRTSIAHVVRHELGLSR